MYIIIKHLFGYKTKIIVFYIGGFFKLHLNLQQIKYNII